MSGGLHFDIDLAQLRAAGAELQATDKQVKLALHYALNRTATTLRTMAARGLRSELELRTINLLRKRLKTLKLRASKDGSGAQLWFGLNDMPASWFKGRPKQTATGAAMRGQEFAGAFVAKSKFKGRLTVFKRTSDKRLHIAEQNLPVSDAATVFIEDKIFDQTEQIFWRYFTRDISARVRFQIGES